MKRIILAIFIITALNTGNSYSADKIAPFDNSNIDMLLMKAAVQGDIAAMQKLLKSSANPNYQGTNGVPILGAVYKSRSTNMLEVVELLAHAGADVNSKIYVIPTVFSLVENPNCNPKILDVLFKYGLNANDSDPIDENSTLEASVAYGGNRACISSLIQHGASVNHTDYAGSNPLIRSVYRKDINIVRLLLQNGAKPNMSDKFGNTALMVSAHFKLTDIASILLHYGANPCFRNELGETASDIAANVGDGKLAELLSCHKIQKSPNLNRAHQ